MNSTGISSLFENDVTESRGTSSSQIETTNVTESRGTSSQIENDVTESRGSSSSQIEKNCKFCKSSEHFTYCSNTDINELISAQEDEYVKSVASEYANTVKKKNQLCYINLVNFFKTKYKCQVPEEVELVFVVCPIKRQRLEHALTKRIRTESKKRAEEARLEAKKRTEEVRLEAKKRADEARLEAKKRADEAHLEAEKQEAYHYALSKIPIPDNWEWYLSDECFTLEAKYQQEYFLVKQGIIIVEDSKVSKEEPKEKPKVLSEKAKRRAINKALAAEREAERKNKLQLQAIYLAERKAKKLESYVPSGW
jgi:hypothetical protein